jgi:hypothetical protein
MKELEERNTRCVNATVENAVADIRSRAKELNLTILGLNISKPYLVSRIIDGVKAVYPEIQATIEKSIGGTRIIFDWSS